MRNFELLLSLLIILYVSRTFADNQENSSVKAPWEPTHTDTLKRSLLAGYDKFARPAHHLQGTNVTTQLSIFHFEFDDDTSIMSLHGWMKLIWHDDKLRWNVSDYGGLKHLHVADHEIWQPDVVQYNSASGNLMDQYGNTNCIIYNDGTVLWVPPTRVNTFCKIDLKKWPQDEQTCHFTFGSWTYDTNQLNLLADTTPVSILDDHLIENTEWELVKVTHSRREKIYECCKDVTYADITYYVQIRRRGNIRATILCSQVAVIVLLSLFGHCLPTSSTAMSSRALLAALPPAILTLALFYLGHSLPETQYSPDIVTLYTRCLYLTLISACVSVFVINVAQERRVMPWFLKKFLGSKAVILVGAPPLHNAHDSTNEELQATGSGCGGDTEKTDGGSLSLSRPWMALATFIDRLALMIFIIITAAFFIAYHC